MRVAVLWVAWVFTTVAGSRPGSLGSFLGGLLGGPRSLAEASGGGPEGASAPRSPVRVVRLDPGPASSSSSSSLAFPGSRAPFPAFLSRGRAPPPRAPPLRAPGGRRGVQMWQRAVEKADRGKMAVALPVGLKDGVSHACSAVAFTQRVTARGCELLLVHNKLCFGPCTSLFVPSAAGDSPGHAPCSRCGPSRSRSVSVRLRCADGLREKRLLLVEECKCETGREERSNEAAANWT